jgi:hypothetical protein
MNTLGRIAMGVLASAVLLLGPIACTRPHQYIDVTCSKMAGGTLLDREAAIQCQTFRQKEAATAVYNEALLLMKSYRACLAKYEGTPPDRAKEYCAEYPKALASVTCSKVAGEVVLGPEVAVQCQASRQADAATAVYNEATLLVRSYRACLEKYEQIPVRAKEYCAQYPKALKEIGLQIDEQPDSASRLSTPNGSSAKSK